MCNEELLRYIEDKEFKPCEDWYFHAARRDIEVVKRILQEGIKSGYLRGEKGNHFNGKYYISLFKYISASKGLALWSLYCPKFIIKGISPTYAKITDSIIRNMLVNTRLPFRKSEWEEEYQEYLMIESSRIIALEYSLAKLASKENTNMQEEIEFLKTMILGLEELNKDLPIYDMSSRHEINKGRVLSL